MIGDVGSAAVPDLTVPQKNRTARHLDRNRGFVKPHRAFAPVRTGHHAGRTVGVGKIGQGPHRVEHQRHVRIGGKVRVVPVERLRGLARKNLHRRSDRQLRLGAQHRADQAQNCRFDQQCVELAGLGEQVEDALRAVAGELVVAEALRGMQPAHGLEDPIGLSLVEQARHDRVACARQLSLVLDQFRFARSAHRRPPQALFSSVRHGGTSRSATGLRSSPQVLTTGFSPRIARPSVASMKRCQVGPVNT